MVNISQELNEIPGKILEEYDTFSSVIVGNFFILLNSQRISPEGISRMRFDNASQLKKHFTRIEDLLSELVIKSEKLAHLNFEMSIHDSNIAERNLDEEVKVVKEKVRIIEEVRRDISIRIKSQMIVDISFVAKNAATALMQAAVVKGSSVSARTSAAKGVIAGIDLVAIDKLGRKVKSSKFVLMLCKKLSVDIYCELLADLGAIYFNTLISSDGSKLSISSFKEIGSKIFHPNAKAFPIMISKQ